MPESGVAGPGLLVGKCCQKRLKSRVGKMFFRLGRLVCGGFAAARILPRARLPTVRWRRSGVRPTFLGFSRAYLCLSMQCLRTCARRTAENVRPCFDGLPRMRAKHVSKAGYRRRLPAQGLGLVRYRFSRQGRFVHGRRRIAGRQFRLEHGVVGFGRRLQRAGRPAAVAHLRHACVFLNATSSPAC